MAVGSADDIDPGIVHVEGFDPGFGELRQRLPGKGDGIAKRSLMHVIKPADAGSSHRGNGFAADDKDSEVMGGLPRINEALEIDDALVRAQFLKVIHRSVPSKAHAL